MDHTIQYDPGTYDVLAQFNGTETNYSNSSNNGNLVLTKTPTILTVDNSTGNSGDTTTIYAHLKDYYGNPVIGMTVQLNINNHILTGTTNENGIVSFDYTSTDNAGNYTSYASFDGDNQYLASTGKGTFKVSKQPSTIEVPNVSGKHGDTVKLVGILTDKNGNPITNKELIFYINGTQIGNATTESAGTAILNYLIGGNIGSYTITVALIGDSTCQNTSGTGTLKVTPIHTNIIVNNATVKHGDKTNLIAVLTDENSKPISEKPIIFSINGTRLGTALTNSNGTATYSYLPIKSGNFIITAYYQGNSIYSSISELSNLTVTPFSKLYLTAQNNKKNPKVGEIFMITYKLGNIGPDTAQNVVISFKIPKGLEFVEASVDSGNWKFNQSTNTVTWTLNKIFVGDPKLYLTLKAINNGKYIITPNIGAQTTINVTKIGKININVPKNNKQNNKINRINSINLPKTGLPIIPLLVGIIMVLGGIATRK